MRPPAPLNSGYNFKSASKIACVAEIFTDFVCCIKKDLVVRLRSAPRRARACNGILGIWRRWILFRLLIAWTSWPSKLHRQGLRNPLEAFSAAFGVQKRKSGLARHQVELDQGKGAASRRHTADHIGLRAHFHHEGVARRHNVGIFPLHWRAPGF
jgi:hypothetical protein